MRRVLISLAVLAVVAVPVAAQQPPAEKKENEAQNQSLGELAKKERERRAKVGKKAAVITNADLKKFSTAPVSQGQLPPEPADTTTLIPTPAEPKDPAAEPSPDVPKNEAYYAPLFAEARLNLKTAVNSDLVLQLKMNELRNRFFVESDGSRRNLIEQEIASTSQQIEAGKLLVMKAREALEKLAQQARADGLPAAWITAQSEWTNEPPVATPGVAIPPPD